MTAKEAGPLSLYVHIPFCIRKCRYCDFLSAPQDEQTREAYVRALIREIGLAGGPGKGPESAGGSEKPAGETEQDLGEAGGPETRPEVDTVFFGGGTPSILSEDQIARILGALRRAYRIRRDAEISLEMNPGTADIGKLRALRRMGFNRLSIGVQSLRDGELRLLGRIHTADQAREAYDQARKAGFDNLSLDLMSALPGQTFEDWADTLARAAAWGPEHISAYSLIIEPDTPFQALYEAGRLPPLPDEETDRRMYHYTCEYLASRGYQRYEISNYARPGRECRHNSGYWTGHQYLGFGIGAASCIDGMRFFNLRGLSEYLACLGEAPGVLKDIRTEVLKDIRTDVHLLTEQERMEEFMFLGLRMTAGVLSRDFSDRFGRRMEDVYGDVIQKHLSRGLLAETPGGICLTERGTDISNYVLSDFLL